MLVNIQNPNYNDDTTSTQARKLNSSNCLLIKWSVTAVCIRAALVLYKTK